MYSQKRIKNELKIVHSNALKSIQRLVFDLSLNAIEKRLYLFYDHNIVHRVI